MTNCIFCKIANKEIEAAIIHEDKEWVCFKDLNPKAPVHLLLIPKKHYSTLHESDGSLYSELMTGIKQIVEAQNLISKGYRIVINSGKDGGQTVNHLHFHILGGRMMGWPPG